MEYLFPSKPLLKRLPLTIDYYYKILFYGEDNLYPQRMEEVRLRSPLLKAATELKEDFLNGSGWELNNAVLLNDRGETGRDLLNLVAKDFSKYDGFALHVNFNGLGKITEIQHIPFEYCRLGFPDPYGNISTVVVSNNWEEDMYKLPPNPRKRIYTDTFPIYNTRTAARDVVGVPQPKGQVLYYSGVERNKYPLASFDAIKDSGETDEAIQKYERNSTNKGFHGATIFKFPGAFESKEQKRELKAMISQWLGPDSPGITVAQIDEDFTGQLMESVPADSNDALFSLTMQNIINRTLYHFTIPPALFGIAPSGGVFTQLAYQESFIVYNVITRNGRNEIQRVFDRLTQNWWQQPFTFGRILENEFAVQEVANQRILNRLGGPTDEQLDETQQEVVDQNTKKQEERILKPVPGEDFT